MPILMIMILIVVITIINSMKFSRRRLLLWLLAGAVFLTACNGSGDDDGRLQIVATTTIWGDVVTQITGELADVEVLIPAGADAHEYEPSPQQLAAVQRADLVLVNGLGLEAGLIDLLDSAAADGANILELAPELDPLPYSEHEDEAHEENGDHSHRDLDPHVWFDLGRVEIAVHLIADQLSSLDDSVDWAERAETYSQKLRAADQEVTGILDQVAPERRKLVTNHDSLGYLAARYGYQVIGVVIPGGSTLVDPSSAEIAGLVAEMIEEDVNVIFAETSHPIRLAETVAAEVGEQVAVVELYTGSLGEAGSDAETLTDMVLTDARRIADALSG